EILKNPYFEEYSPRGTRFAKAVRADKVFVRNIGLNALQSLKNVGIEVHQISSDKKIDEILNSLTEKQ
ncbi:hypothetical protein J7L09_01555, partial [bacterium]|nr:hypothetical protein [bacterium]